MDFTPDIRRKPSLRKKKDSLSFKLILTAYRLYFQTIGRIIPKRAGEQAFRLFATPRRKLYLPKNKLIRRSKKSFIEIEGKQVQCYEWGKPSQPAVLLVHGWNSGAADMIFFVPNLISKNFRVLAFDGPAHGNSGGERSNVLEFAAVIKHYLQHEKDLHHIIAHSMGVASTILAQKSQKAAIDKFIFIASPSRFDQVFDQFFSIIRLPGKAGNLLLQSLERRFGMHPRELSVGEILSDISPDKVLLVHDLNDRDVSFDSARDIYEHFPSIKMLVTENFGHMRIIKDQRVISEMIEFITED